MESLILKTVFTLLGRLVTEKFIAKIAVYSLRAWSKTTANTWDDHVTEAIADALGVEPETVKVAS